MKKTIDISVVIGTDIRTRSRIRQLTDLITQDATYNVDFSKVEFISRSFADELVSFIDNSAGRVVCINMPEHIKQLLIIVRRNRNVHTSIQDVKGDVVKLETKEQMEAFFNAF